MLFSLLKGCRKTTMTKNPPNWLNRGSVAVLPAFIGAGVLIRLWTSGALNPPNVYAWAETGLACALLALAAGVLFNPHPGSKLLYVFSGGMIIFSAGLAIPISQPWAFIALIGGLVLLLIKGVGLKNTPTT